MPRSCGKSISSCTGGTGTTVRRRSTSRLTSCTVFTHKMSESKKSEELRELLGLEPVSLMIKKSKLRWFGHVERKDDNDWVKRCIRWEVEGIRPRGRPKKTWWDCVKNNMESLGLSQKDAQSRNKWRRRIKGATG